MKRLFSVIAVISVIAAAGMVMTACGSDKQSSEGTTASQTTAAGQETTASTEKETAQQTTAAQETTAAPKSNDDKQSSDTETKSDTAEKKDDSGSAEAFAGIAEEDAKVMALLDLVTEDASVESCKQGKDKNDADCWVIILKDADNDRYISYVNAEGSTTLPYNE